MPTAIRVVTARLSAVTNADHVGPGQQARHEPSTVLQHGVIVRAATEMLSSAVFCWPLPPLGEGDAIVAVGGRLLVPRKRNAQLTYVSCIYPVVA